MKSDDTLTVRLPIRVKDEIAEIADANGLTLSKAAIQLLAKAIAFYREDGILIDERNRRVLSGEATEVKAEKRRAG